MTIRNLQFMFKPASVALIGAGQTPSSAGAVVAHNLFSAGFKGEIFLVTKEFKTIEGVATYPDIAHLPKAPDLAVITAPSDSVPRLIAELGARGTKAAVIITGGLGESAGERGQKARNAILDAAKSHHLRIAGPGSLGVMVPGGRLNASLSHVRPLQGNLAFIAQSGSVMTSILDWATSRNIGFTHLVSLGDTLDLDFGDTMDYLGGDPNTRAVLLYIESVSQVRKFMSAARTLARIKPVIVLKSGKHAERYQTALARVGKRVGADAVYAAAFRRAGMLRVNDMEQLFNAVETLAMTLSIPGDRLAVLTNGGGMGMLAADVLIDKEGCLAELSSDSMERLRGVLSPSWFPGNPVDLGRSASPKRYADALEVLLNDREIDAVLALNCPNGMVSGLNAAQEIVRVMKKSEGRPKVGRLFTNWLGSETSAVDARRLFTENRIPTYETPSDAVRGFMQVVRYRRNQENLMQIPPTIPEDFTPDTEKARGIIHRALAEDRSRLTEAEGKDLLTAYSIPTAETFGTAAVQSIECPHGHELLIGVMADAQFGPMILFGHGGAAAHLMRDKALALPPLNMHLAREVMARTRVFRLLRGGKELPPANLDSIALTLVKVSQLICDMADIAELDINPLLADEKGVTALNAWFKITKSAVPAADRLSIRPYPKELEETINLPDGHTLLLRPIRPEDEPAYHRLFSRLSPEDIRLRFLSPVKEISRALAVRLTQIDYDREMALILVEQGDSGEQELYGGVRLMGEPGSDRAEFAILLHRRMTGMGLGPMLMRRIIDYARKKGIREIFGEALAENRPMLRLCQVFGFTIKRNPEDFGVMELLLRLGEE